MISASASGVLGSSFGRVEAISLPLLPDAVKIEISGMSYEPRSAVVVIDRKDVRELIKLLEFVVASK